MVLQLGAGIKYGLNLAVELGLGVLFGVMVVSKQLLEKDIGGIILIEKVGFIREQKI